MGGDWAHGVSQTVVLKFFNRSPITLKFGAEKLERESLERESESESEREREREIERERDRGLD